MLDRTEILFVSLAVLGLAGTWAQGLGYLDLGLLGANVQFWKDAVASPAGAFLTVDIFILGAALFTWMFAEGRRLGIGSGWLWSYFLGSLFVAISCAVPLFLAHRHRRLRTQRPVELALPQGSDWLPIAIGILLAVVAVAYSLTHPA
jgi:hypothetical protein